MQIRKILASCLVVLTPFVYGCSDTEGFKVVGGKPAIVSSAPLEKIVRHIPGADAKTFQSLNNAMDALAIYAVDAEHAYVGYWGHAMRIESADPTSFSIASSDGAYATDRKRVYWFGVEINRADPATFRIVKAPYAVDANQAYSGIFPFDVHSLKNFEVLATKDRVRPIENRGKSVVIRDREEIVMSGWARDGVAYYWGAVRLDGADYHSMQILNCYHAKDRDTVYYGGKPIPGADAESFIVESSSVIRGRDKNFEYKKGQRVGPRKE